jgi:predicted amidophosphoribosyltransferase
MSNITKSKFKRCLRCGRKIAVKGDYCKTCEDKNIAEAIKKREQEEASKFWEQYEQTLKQLRKEHPEYFQKPIE